jgi:hypothetical protein
VIGAVVTAATTATAKQRNSQTTEQPNNGTAKQQNSQTTEQPNNRTAKQQNSQTTEQPNNRTAKQQNSLSPRTARELQEGADDVFELRSAGHTSKNTECELRIGALNAFGSLLLFSCCSR